MPLWGFLLGFEPEWNFRATDLWWDQGQGLLLTALSDPFVPVVP